MIRDLAGDGSGIAWIASYPKSGNTWIRAFVHCLNMLAAGRQLESGYLDEIDQTVLMIGALTRAIEQVTGKPREQLTFSDAAASRPAAEARIAAGRKGLVLIKTHTVRAVFEGAPTIDPRLTVGAVYVVRDPFDVAVSLKHFLDCSQDQAIAIMNRKNFGGVASTQFEIWGSWSENVLSWAEQPSPEVLVLRYEDLLGDPVRALAGVSRHLRMRVAPPQIVEATQKASFTNLRKAEGDGGFSERPESSERFFRSGRTGEGRRSLTRAQMKAIVEEHGATMERFGYSTSMDVQ
jgi:hypothetical protein